MLITATVVEGGSYVHVVFDVPTESDKHFVDDCSFKNGIANCTQGVLQSKTTLVITTKTISASFQDVQVRYISILFLRARVVSLPVSRQSVLA